MINYKHLHYFWIVAKEGSITRASEQLHLTPQTISGQLSLLEEYLGVSLFSKVGRNLEVTDVGRRVLSYAEDIFSLGNELDQMIRTLPSEQPQMLKVGVVDVVPKSIAHRILLPALKMPESTRMICREADLETLLAELTLHRLDLVIADRPIPSTVSTRAFSHSLGECAVSFFASENLAHQLSGTFPDCLNNAPLLLPSKGNQLRTAIDMWLLKHRITPNIAAEFDDSALLKTFGQEGVGIFIAPTAIEEEVKVQFKVNVIGKTDEIKEAFFAISIEKRISNPIVSTVIESASNTLFSGLNKYEQ